MRQMSPVNESHAASDLENCRFLGERLEVGSIRADTAPPSPQTRRYFLAPRRRAARVEALWASPKRMDGRLFRDLGQPAGGQSEARSCGRIRLARSPI